MSNWKDLLYFSRADRRAMVVFCVILAASTGFRMWWYPHHRKIEIPVTDSIVALVTPQATPRENTNSRANNNNNARGKQSNPSGGLSNSSVGTNNSNRTNSKSRENNYGNGRAAGIGSNTNYGNGSTPGIGGNTNYGNGSNPGIEENNYGNRRDAKIEENNYGNGSTPGIGGNANYGNGENGYYGKNIDENASFYYSNSQNESNQYIDGKSDETPKPVLFERQKKLAKGEQLDLNTADTTELKMVPGIGSYYARRILEYKSQLGGYYDVKQLSEIRGLPDSVQWWFFVTESTMNLQQIDLNSASITQLNRHPYLNFQQARAITDARKAGRIKGADRLRLLDEFPDSALQRLLPYLNF